MSEAMDLQTRMIRNIIMPNMSEKSNRPRAAQPSDAVVQSGAGRVVESTDLLAGQSEVVIRHEGRTYRLRRTRLGKLILTA
jgi:hemin uptake protein HemP